jgi:DNA-binding response OmpR family regulator
MIKILIVEDDDDMRRGLGLRLISWGYSVVQASDGYYAMDVARREMPDAVLLDLGLPGGDGISVLERYAKNLQLSTIPVIVLTGRDTFAIESTVREYNVRAFLRKPVDNDELARALAQATGAAGSDASSEHGRHLAG